VNIGSKGVNESPWNQKLTPKYHQPPQCLFRVDCLSLKTVGWIQHDSFYHTSSTRQKVWRYMTYPPRKLTNDNETKTNSWRCLLKMVTFQCHVSFRKGNSLPLHPRNLTPKIVDFPASQSLVFSGVKFCSFCREASPPRTALIFSPGFEGCHPVRSNYLSYRIHGYDVKHHKKRWTYHSWHWMFYPVAGEKWPEIYHGGTTNMFFLQSISTKYRGA